MTVGDLSLAIGWIGYLRLGETVVPFSDSSSGDSSSEEDEVTVVRLRLLLGDDDGATELARDRVQQMGEAASRSADL